jgi:hypothetical protein
MKELKREFVVDPQTDRGLKEWAEEENRSLRNLASVIIRREVSAWRTRRQQQQATKNANAER